MPDERYQALQGHQRFCGALAGRRSKRWQLLPVMATIGFAQKVMGRHAMFALRLSVIRGVSRYFSGLNFVFALPLVHTHGKFSLRTVERLIATQPPLMQFFHATELTNILRHAGGVSLSHSVAPLPITPPTLRAESQLAAGRAPGDIVLLTPTVSHSTSLGQNSLNRNMSLFQSRMSIFHLSQQRLINNLSYNVRNIFAESKLAVKGGEVINRPRQDWPRQGLSFVRQFAGWPRNASAAKIDDARMAPEKSHDDLTLQAGMPRADAETTRASDHQTFADLQNLIVAQNRFADYSPEKIPSQVFFEKNHLLPATAPELIHKAYQTADSKSQARPAGEKDDNNAEAVAQRRFKPIGIAEPPAPEAFKSIDRLADHVITIIEKRLQTERERRGIFA